MPGVHFGYAHHNPGNIRWNARDKWQGLAQAIPEGIPPEPGRYEKTANGVRFVPAWDSTGVGFFVFEDPTMGLRAVARTLISYQDRYGDRTLVQLFKRYAPGGDFGNNPLSYASSVGRLIDKNAVDPIDAHEYGVLRAMLPAICKIETGQTPPYTDAQYDKALVLAGVKSPEQPITKSRTVQGATVTTVGGLANQAAADAADAVKKAGEATDSQWLIDTGTSLLPILKWVGAALVIAGIVAIVWARIDDRRKGLR